MNNLGKVKLLPAREQVASILRKAILSRELQEGQEITLEGIAELVGVSTTPVREAFQILARDGLIKLRPNKGAVVQGINEKTIRDHYETRAVLEGEAAARASAEGVDIDPVAVRTAGENAALNGVQDKLTVLVGDLSDKASGKYDIITANIVANAILSLAPAVPGLMAEGATFIASGIIDSRKDEVISGLEKAGLAVVEVKEKRGWECIVCKKA